MGAPITIKKRKVTLKPAGADASATDDAPVDSAVPAELLDGGEVDSTPFTSPIPAHLTAKHAAPSYTVYAILAIFATLFFIALLVLQWSEWTYLLPQFPHPIQTGQIVSPSN